MLKITSTGLKEIGYDIQDEAKLSTIFGIGNGYFGIRGSFEEFGDVFVQGTYIRGLFDQIVEIPMTFPDNIYMKNYYFDVQKLKEFEQEDSCIDLCDPLTIRIYVNGKLFLPWQGKVVKWNRYIDTSTGGLYRKVIWDDGEGHLSEFVFYRCASFADNHLILQKVSIKKLNHKLPIELLLGVDTLVKTNGQHKSQLTDNKVFNDGVNLSFYVGNKYNMEASLMSHNEVEGFTFKEQKIDKGVYGSVYTMDKDSGVAYKVTSIYASIDPVDDFKQSAIDGLKEYKKAYSEHLKSYKPAFKLVDIKVDGDNKVDQLLRYANYQTLIGFDRHDSVHSLSAKNLTAEKYNQFVWWDAEIFQLPFVISNFPNAARSCLEYRYRLLEQSKINAKLDGYDGAKYAFCSSVKGDENVWIYARHPFLQIHINGDVAYGVINYYQQTLDQKFLVEKGLPMMVEILKYFFSRSTFDGNLYHLNNVTGTDEHHPYIDDNAYTNYQVRYIATKTLEYISKFNYHVETIDLEHIKTLKDKLYLPLPSKDGIIPQFRGYLELKPYLPLVGNGSAKGFQMKASGLYHQSQIIKQPDVLNLYTYLDVDMPQDIYKANWKYYYKKCEASSSLTFPVHTISAIDFNENKVFLENLLSSLQIDIEDIHNCAYQGVHAGCLAGGWFAFYRGIFGIKPRENELIVNPKFSNPFKNVSMNFIYQGHLYHISLSHQKFVIESDHSFEINYQGNIVSSKNGRIEIHKNH